MQLITSPRKSRHCFIMGKHVKELSKIIDEIVHYYCSRCKTYKPEPEMYMSESSIKRRDMSCIACSKTRSREFRLRNFLRCLVSNAKSRATRKGIVFNIVEDDLTIPEVCPLLGILLVIGNNVDTRNSSPSIDRIDNTLGYIRGNVRIISFLANSMKRDVPKEYLINFADNIKQYMT